MKPWIKFSTGIHRDRKIWKLSKDAQLVFFHLLSIAGSEENDDGILPSFEDISLELWFLKYNDSTLKKLIYELADSEIIEIDGNGVIRLKNFTKWQTAEKTKSEKNREYYERSLKKNPENLGETSQKTRKTSKKFSQDSAEIQKKFSRNSEKIQSEFSQDSENAKTEIQKNSDEIQSLDIDIDIDKEKDIEKDKDSFVCAKAQTTEIQSTENSEKTEIQKNSEKQKSEIQKSKTESQKEKLTPDQHEFWKFAKENSEMAEEFYKATGVFPVKKEFGRWVNDLRDLAEAGITVADMQTAVMHMRGENISIGAPGSVLKTARWLKVNSATKNNKPKNESFLEIAERLTAEEEKSNFGFDFGFDFGHESPEGDVIDL